MGALGGTRPGATLTVEQCGPSSAMFGPTQATGTDVGREGRGARGMGDAVPLRRSPCHWHKDIARKLHMQGQFVHSPFSSQQPSLCFQ